MFAFKTLDGIEVKFSNTCKVNGPLQEGGLSFGCSSIWISVDGGKTYAHIDERSNLKVRNTIENNTLSDLIKIFNL